MKVVHKNLNEKDTSGNWLEKARQLEQQNEADKAASAYEKVIKENPLNEYAYDRLMIIYRKNKDYKKEKLVIGRAIKTFEQFYKSASRISSSKKIVSLSKAFMRSTGLADRKGKLLYQKEPLARWNKRKATVEKKLKA